MVTGLSEGTEKAKEVMEQWLDPNLNYPAGATNTWAVDEEAIQWVPFAASLYACLPKQKHPKTRPSLCPSF